jgi:hypothetical protein
MKDQWKSGVLVLLIIAVLYIIFLRECKRVDPCPAEDEMIIKRSAWDSILAAAALPPVVTRDTVWLKGDTVFVNADLPGPVVDPVDTTVNHYVDSLVRKDIDVRIRFSVRGELLSRSWQYNPVYREIRVDSIVFRPYPVEVIKEVPVSRAGLYGYGVAGGNGDAFLFGGGVDFMTRKETEIGYMYQRYGGVGFHSVKLGVKLFGSGRRAQGSGR